MKGYKEVLEVAPMSPTDSLVSLSTLEGLSYFFLREEIIRKLPYILDLESNVASLLMESKNNGFGGRKR